MRFNPYATMSSTSASLLANLTVAATESGEQGTAAAMRWLIDSIRMMASHILSLEQEIAQMAYCRFSSDDFQCDVYTYADVNGGFTTHVARYRYVMDDLPPPVELKDPEKEGGKESFVAWFERHRRIMKIVEAAPQEPIGLPCDGMSFNDDTAGEAADRLEQLRTMGYRLPQSAIDALRQEQQNPTLDSEG